MSSYNHFAYIYDDLMQHAPYDEWVDFTRHFIKEKTPRVQSIIDLGCGTGEISIRLAALGYDVIGVDYSEQMLACASEKAIKKKLPINWINQDITQLSGFNSIDLFISYCDVINYVTNVEDVKSVFKRVHESLSANGMFIFDIHSLSYAESHLMNGTFTDVTDEIVYIWDCEKGDEQGEMYHHLTFFKEDGDKYIRFDETHHQQTYDILIYEQLLKSSGFNKIQFYNDFKPENEFSAKKSERIFIVAEK